MLFHLFHDVQVVTVRAPACAVFKEQDGADQPAHGEQQVCDAEQHQRLQLRTHTHTGITAC